MRTLPELHALFNQLSEQRRQAWAETDISRESECSSLIERVLLETIEHPDYVKQPC